ncbi:MAG: mevalonate kinase [Bdellovibrionales bacterium]|nr:mevalonate kinase [Bdellovibrionales bacterium]
MLKFWIQAPSNIACVKYMGKKEVPGQKNVAENPSLSMTLSSLSTFQTWEEIPSGLELVAEDPKLLGLDEKSVERMLGHVRFVQAQAPAYLNRLGIPVSDPSRGWKITTSNSFPAGAGIASSASSFAAATLGAVVACAKDPGAALEKILATEASDRATWNFLTDLSRQGSGSSCRSFFGPFVGWTESGVTLLESRMPKLVDLVCVVEETQKKISSSQAHSRVKSSPLWSARVKNATQRFEKAKAAISKGGVEGFSELAKIARADSDEMHLLFETSVPGFSYANATSRLIQEFVSTLPEAEFAFCTLDAGPNVHVLVVADYAEAVRHQLERRFPEVRILSDVAGRGIQGAAFSFHSKVPGKIILTGEHAVLRGGRAVSIPCPDYFLRMTFQPKNENGFQSPDLDESVLAQWKEKLPSGKLRVESTIPVGSGLGSSAALSVALARFLVAVGAARLTEDFSEWNLARSIEDQFHGKSSGLDVATVAGEVPIVFQNGKASKLASLGARFSVHDSRVRLPTREAIAQVQGLRTQDPARAQEIDLRMDQASQKAQAALAAGNLNDLAQAMNDAQGCFQDWGLVPSQAYEMMESLKQKGALAVKMTGAGGGGMVLALWPDNRL